MSARRRFQAHRAGSMSWRHRWYHLLSETLELPMLALSLVVIPIVFGPMILDLPTSLENALEIAGWCIFAAFATELMLMLWLAPSAVAHLRSR